MGVQLRPCIVTINEQVGIRKKPHSTSLTQKQKLCSWDDLWPGELGLLTWCNHSLHWVSVSYVHWGVHRIWAPSASVNRTVTWRLTKKYILCKIQRSGTLFVLFVKAQAVMKCSFPSCLQTSGGRKPVRNVIFLHFELAPQFTSSLKTWPECNDGV